MSAIDLAVEGWRRRVLLHVLGQATAGRANDSVLQMALARAGLSASRDVVRTELSWLREQGLVTLEEFDDLAVAVLTRRGRDVADGLADVPGVARRES